MTDRLIARYLKVCEEVAREFQRNRDLHGGRIRCGKGCSDCCGQIFQITEVEAAYISKYVKSLPDAQRKRLIEKARAYLPAREALMKAHGAVEAWGTLPKPGMRLACPALVDGACTIYEHRPLICRKYGMPLYNPQKPDQIFACELNFRPGEEVVDDRLIQIQTEIYHHWRDVQADYNDAGGKRDGRPISIARAIVEDFEPYLPE